MQMKVMVYAIGGDLNGQFLGCAHDPETGLSLLKLIELAGGYACSLHGDCLIDLNAGSGEYILQHARATFILAQCKRDLKKARNRRPAKAS